MSIERDAMYAAFEESPGDLVGYLAMSDELTALGYPALAHAFHWMSKRGIYPHKRMNYSSSTGVAGRKVPAMFRWAWYHAFYRSDPFVRKVYPFGDRRIHGLPSLLLHSEQKTCRSHQEAVMFLATQLATVGEVYNVEPPKPKGLPLYDVIDTGNIRQPPLFTEEGA